MPQHGEIDKEKKLVYCGYWMTFEDWEDIHKYSPDVDESEDDEKETVKDIA
jgi:hypothetical protein